jgi:hypothetical protein
MPDVRAQLASLGLTPGMALEAAEQRHPSDESESAVGAAVLGDVGAGTTDRELGQ